MGGLGSEVRVLDANEHTKSVAFGFLSCDFGDSWTTEGEFQRETYRFIGGSLRGRERGS